MSRIAKLLSYRIMKYDKSWNESKEILEYSITLFLESVFVLVSFLGIVVFFGEFLIGLTFMITLVLMRNYFGGGHASSFRICYCISNLAFFSAILFLNNAAEFPHFGIAVILILSVFIYTFKRNNMRKNLYFCVIAVIATFLFLKNISFGYSLLVSCLLTALADQIFNHKEVKK